MLMGKGYNLLASGSGRVPDGCTSASWRRAAKLTSSADAAADADNEHEEMVNELQAMVLIGDQWANAPNDDPSSEDNPIPSNRDPETAKIMRTENEGDSWNNTKQNVVDKVDGSDAAPETIETVEDYSQNLYSTLTRSTSILQSSLQAVDSALSPMYNHNDELLPLPVHEDICPPRDASPLSSSPSLSHTFAHQPQIHASDVKSLDDVEESTEIEFQGTPLGEENCDDDESVSVRHTQGHHSDKEVEGLDELMVERHPDDNGSSNPQPRSPTSSSVQHGELSDATPRRSSQLSKTLRNNLERLLQRGPVPLAATKTGSSSRRRKTKRDDGQTTSSKRQTTKQHHRHHHHHHHHHHRHHHHHSQQQQKQEEHQREAGLYKIQDDVQSLATDTDTILSLSATSLSSISSNSDGILLTSFCC